MNSQRNKVTLTGAVLDEFTEVTIDDLCRTCHVERTMIVSLVEEGVVEPNSREESPWRFSGNSLPIVARALRLQNDLNLNPAGVAFALDLLEEIETLRNRVRLYEGE